MSRAKITYRFYPDSAKSTKPVQSPHPPQENRESLTDTPEIKDTSSLNPVTSDYSAWSSPFEVETEKLERQIRESFTQKDPLFGEPWSFGRMPAQKVDPVTGYFDYGMENEGPEWDETLTKSSLMRRKSQNFWSKMLTSALGAVLTGMLFGVFFITMFTDGESATSLEPLDWPSQGNQTPQDGFAENGKMPGGPDSSHEVQSTGQVSIPPREYVVLQNGVFSSLEGAKSAESDLREKGFAPVLEEEGQHYVFVGLATNRDDVLFLTSRFQEQDVEVYIKTLTLPALENIRWRGDDPEALQTFLEMGDRLTRLISDRTLALLQGEKAEGSLDQIVSEHQQWSRLLNDIAQALPKEVNGELQRMNQGMMLAVEALKAYEKNASSSYLWQAQSGLLQFVIAHKHLLQSISADGGL